MKEAQSHVTTSSLLKVQEPTQDTQPGRRNSTARVILVLMTFISVANTIVLGVSDVVAISGFVDSVGTHNLPWLWIADMLAGLVLSAIYLPLLDRVPRMRMQKTVLLILAMAYLVVSILTLAGLSEKIIYPLLYVMYSQQVLIFPIVFWNLASGLYKLSEARRVFPILASGETIGRLIGYALFSLPLLAGLAGFSTWLAQHPGILLLAGVLLFAASLVLIQVVLRGQNDPIPDKQPEWGWRKNLQEGVEILQKVPFFTYLTASYTLVWVGLTILWYQFYVALDTLAGEAARFNAYYSAYNIAALVVPLAIQWSLTRTLMRTTEIKHALVVLPVSLLFGLVIAWASAGNFASIAAISLPIVLMNAWDTPISQSMQHLIPENRRGRVNAILNNYSYAFGTIAGSLIAAVLILSGLSASLVRILLLACASLAALAALAAVFRARALYDESLLSWRLNSRKLSTGIFQRIK